ncbi:hypothetical protein JCM33374_g1264 [Metschnikowia sp. JCM 33374]|nr:hypothetical protein JCM33374_g1264 [Metschnikowia sp. JCM 33374]
MTVPVNVTCLEKHFQNMALAVFVAFRALQNGETPVACVFVHEPSQSILSYGCNDTNRSLNGTRHAEFLGIDKILAQKKLLGASRSTIASFFRDVVLYVTIEPCVMCASALQHVGIGKVYFGAANDRFGGNGTVIKAQGDNSYRSIGGILRPEAISLLRNFYIQENDSAPVPKVKKNKDIEGKEFPENLDFPLYITQSDFVAELGEERLAQFYYKRNQHDEITPRPGKGYTFGDLLTEESVKRIPDYQQLYPGSACDINKDLECLQCMLPKVNASGAVDLEQTLEVKKRKLHESA